LVVATGAGVGVGVGAAALGDAGLLDDPPHATRQVQRIADATDEVERVRRIPLSFEWAGTRCRPVGALYQLS
jgi:hypothetical protein